MTRRFRAAVFAAALAAAAPTAQAADLDYRDYGAPKRYGSAYDDPRYADLYGDDPPATRPIPERRYGEPRPGYGHPPIPREPIYRDEEYAPRRFAETYPRYRAYSAGPGCLGKDEVRWRLERDGWHDFHDPQVVDRGTAWVKARRASGRVFQLQVDRCSGDIIAARPLEPRYGGPYADYDARPRYRY